MGCGASKDDIAEPRAMQPHGRDNFQRIDKEAAIKPIDLTSECICSLYNSSSAVLNNSSSPPSVFIHTPDLVSSVEDDVDDGDFDPSFDIPSKLSIIDEADTTATQTTALAALSGAKDVIDTDVEERVEAILDANNEVLIGEQSAECSAHGMLTSHSAILQALLSTGPVITEQNLGGDFSARVGHVAVISRPEPIRWDPLLRKAEIIDLDEDPDAGDSLMLENTPEQQENQSDQEPADDEHALKQLGEESVPSLTEEQPKQDPKPDDAVDTHKALEPRKPKLPPLTVVPPVFVDIPANPFAKPAFTIVIKQDLVEVKAPFICETDEFEDLSADRAPADEDSPNRDNCDVRSKSSLVTGHEDGTPTPATMSSAYSDWRSVHRDIPDPDIENIDLLESPELDSLPLIPMLDCHGIHKDKKDLISPSLRLVS